MPDGMLTAVKASVADAVQLLLEKSTMQAHTVSFVVIEPTDRISHERLHALVGSSLPRLPRFRSRLVDRPLGVGPPFWAEIEDYDPASQIHRVTLRAPGGEREFADLIARLSEEPGHHREMLWKAWSIDGLSGGRWALAVRTSPALSERGAGIPTIWSRLLRSDQHDDRRGDPTPLSSPAVTGDLITSVVGELLEFQFKGLWLATETVAGLLGALRRKLSGNHVADQPDSMPLTVSSMSGPLPRNVFNAPLTDERAVAFASIRRADLETVSSAFGGDVTNVLVAACTLSLRAWLQRHDSVPDDPLMMRMPLALSGAALDVDDDSPVAGKIRIPVQLSDPVEVLTNLHTASEKMNIERGLTAEKAYFTDDFVHLASLVPSSVSHAGMQIFSRLSLRQRLAPTSHGSICYVGDEASPSYCAGARVIGMHTVTPLLDAGGLTITVTAHGEVMDLSVCVCPDNVPAVADIATGIVDSLDVLVTEAGKTPRGQGRSVVTEMTSKRRQARAY